MTNALSDRPSQDRAAPVTLFIVDDHGLLRSVMSLAMRALSGIEVIGQAENGRVAVDEVTKAQPDIVLMDIVMLLLDGLAATRRICRQSPRASVVVLIAAAQPELVLDVLRVGATGLVSKSAELAELERAI
jgi:DNA-binding NarL/FixJ family response regulator